MIMVVARFTHIPHASVDGVLERGHSSLILLLSSPVASWNSVFLDAESSVSSYSWLDIARSLGVDADDYDDIDWDVVMERVFEDIAGRWRSLGFKIIWLREPSGRLIPVAVVDDCFWVAVDVSPHDPDNTTLHLIFITSNTPLNIQLAKKALEQLYRIDDDTLRNGRAELVYRPATGEYQVLPLPDE